MPAFTTASSDARALPAPSLSVPAFLRSVMPALDRAFGLEAGPDLPERLAALVARIEEGRERWSADGAAVSSVVPMLRHDPEYAAVACGDPVAGPGAATVPQPVTQSFPMSVPASLPVAA